MFLRAYRRNKDGKPHTYYALVESVRTEAGPRQHVVAYLGELNSAQERHWQRTVVFYNREGEAQELRLFPDDENVPLPDDPDVARIRLASVGWSNGRRFGDVWLARWLWHYLGLDEIVARHVPQGKETVRPADVVAIEVINRLCQPCSEFALAEHWYAATGLEELLGVPDSAVTKDRLYRTLTQLLRGQEKIENDLKERFGVLFQVDYELVLYDLTSSYFEGLAEDNELAQRGYSRDHRSDCKQVVVALVVTREGFPLAHYTWAGNTRDVQTVKRIVNAIEARFGKSNRIWVMDRGMISEESLAFLSEPGRRYLLATYRKALAAFDDELCSAGWQRLPDNPDVEVKIFDREREAEDESKSKGKRKRKDKSERAKKSQAERAEDRAVERVADHQTEHTQEHAGEAQHAEAQHAEAQHAEAQHAEAQHAEAQHAETPHAETPHAETPHAEAQHAEAQHAEAPHAETPHAEAQHAEAPHAEAPHAETPHAEMPHAETPHAETQHAETQHAGERVYYLLARSRPRRHKERAIRRRQRRALAKGLKKLQARVARGRLKKPDKIHQAIGRLTGRYPKARGFVTINVSDTPVSVTCTWKIAKFKKALARDGAYLLRSNHAGWSAQEFWETYIQLTVVERAFRVLKTELLLRPIWHQYSSRTQAHIFVCVLAYALWKTLDHLAKRANLQTLIRKPDAEQGDADPKPRPMTPEVILRELAKIQIGDIQLETTAGQKLALRRVARPDSEQKRILEALGLDLPERLSSDRLL